MVDYSLLPSIQEVDQALKAADAPQGAAARSAVNRVLNLYRTESARLEGHDKKSLLKTIVCQVVEQVPRFVSVINATGTVIHTNLGRSPLSEQALKQIPLLFSGYCNLEYDLSSGKRGQRGGQVENLLCQLTGAEAALVVNNNAAAVMLALHCLARGKEVLLSRGEMVEIGGSFRIPEILEASGAKLKELGTTNKTKLSDYQKALSPEVALVLRVHRSNFQITGFTEQVERSVLSSWAKQQNLPLVEDLGSGSLESVVINAKVVELGMREVLGQGVSLLTASGDKLLGGPQAGLILGSKAQIDQLRSDPLYRCLRCDKITLYLLEQTLLAYGDKQPESIPLHQLLQAPVEALEARAQAVRQRCPSVDLAVVPSLATPGGGALPGQTLGSVALSLKVSKVSVEKLHKRLRMGDPPVIGRISGNTLLLDMRTVFEFQVPLLAASLNRLGASV